MKKRIFAAALALCLCIGLMPMGAMAAEGEAAEAATITAYQAGSTEATGTYTTIDAAVNAAGENGKVVISEGVLAVNGRQTIAKAGVTVEGAGRDKTFLVTSENFKNGSTTNKKALLTVGADDVTVKGMTIDGSTFGDTIDMTDTSEGAFNDFVIVRVNAGKDKGVRLENILITGSPKTLLQIGTGGLFDGVSAKVTASELYCEAMPKSIADGRVYGDIDVVNRSSLTVVSGAVHGFIAKDIFANYTFEPECEPMFAIRYQQSALIGWDIMTTLKHFVDNYTAMREEALENAKDYQSAFVDDKNEETVKDMVDHAIGMIDTDRQTVEGFVSLLTDAREFTTDAGVKGTLQAHIDTLNGKLAEQ